MANDRTERIKLLKSLFKQKIMVLDGATGTSIQNMNLVSDDFGGDEYEGVNELLNLKAPHVVEKIHHEYLDAGADIIETNTFGATPIVLDEYNLSEKCHEINLKSGTLARKKADEFSTKEKPRFVAGSIGPTTKSLSVTGKITFSEMVDNYSTQVKALYESGVDYFLIETCNDTSNIKSALAAITDFYNALPNESEHLPIAISVTVEPTGTMLAGQTVESLVVSVEHIDLLYVGINCAFGPSQMKEYVESISNCAQTYVSCVPNAGLPDENGVYQEGPDVVAKVLENYVDQGLLNLIGGCCGTTPDHIRAMSKMVASKKPRIFKSTSNSKLSGIDILNVSETKRPILIGERANSIGSKKFRELITSRKFDEAAEIARAQIKKGAHVVDICLANPDSDEFKDMQDFLVKAMPKIRVPIMIDSTDTSVVEMALKFSQGKAIINSINLEEGEERFKAIVPLIKKYGAGIVVGTIDEDPNNGMAVTRERKLEIAKRSYKLLTEKYEIPPQDLYFDPLVFPCATGDEKYSGAAKETVEGLRLIKQSLKNSNTILGVSNVSFGLPLNGREVLNSVFLHHCVQAGMDMAIINTEKIRNYDEIPSNETELAENVLWSKGDDPISEFTQYFRSKKSIKKKTISTSDLTISEKVTNSVIETSKTGLDSNIAELLKTMTPIEIINGPLMKGMSEVGKLFNSNKLIVAEVLQSAEIMKHAVSVLESHLKGEEKIESRETILLATVKGDVHDIGKDLVEIVLGNNGYNIINLGIKITSEQIVEAVKKHQPGIIGLSGLLVKSAQEMIAVAKDLQKANINVPVIVGGAALSQNFVTKKIEPHYPDGKVYYAKDAMDGLQICNEIVTS